MQCLVSSPGFDPSEIVPSVGTSGGLALMWNDTVTFNIIISNTNLINCMVCDDACFPDWLFTFIYGPPVPGMRPAFWDQLTTIGDSFNGAWSLIGDFNTLLSQADKQGGRAVSNSSVGGFQHFINTFGLLDLGFTGHPFTWSNRRSGDSHIQERLDRGFANTQWKI